MWSPCRLWAVVIRKGLVFILMVGLSPLSGDEASPTAPVMVLVDTSGSMSAERIKSAVEAGKLFVFLSDGSLVVGHFADEAQVSPMFDLPKDWDAAAARFEALIQAVGGGT